MNESGPSAQDAANWGGPREMSAWEGLMWRAERDPRTRSTGILLELLDREPDWERLVSAFERTSRRIPRLRDRVVEPPVPIVQPAWSPDPEFSVRNHLRRVELGPAAGIREVLSHCETEWHTRFAPARPPWEATLFCGLRDGTAALAFRLHHSLSDGMGLVQLLELAHEGDPDADTGGARSAAPVTPVGVLVDATRRAADPGTLFRAVRRGVDRSLRGLNDPLGLVADVTGYASSLSRMLAIPDAKRSPLLADRGSGTRLLILDVPLRDLKSAGTAAGGSVNDAFIAAILGGLRRYHDYKKVPIDEVVIGMPVSLRNENDPLGGNRFAGIRFPGPAGELDPARRIRAIREHVITARDEPAIGFLDFLSPMLTRLPTRAIIELSAGLTTGSDVQISNIRGIGHPVRLAGAEVLGTYPLGPRPGVAAMVTMITYNGVCCLGLTVDPRVFDDTEAFQESMSEGFAEVLALTRQEGKGI
jgi:WS/DGAT/MGAT family acyltransferase